MIVRNSSAEFEILSRLATRSRGDDRNLTLGIGDDAALLEFSDTRLAVSTDALVEGVHFDLAYFTISDLAAKAIAVNASDLAAMGARPRYFLVTVVSRAGIDTEALVVALEEECALHHGNLIGGDLSSGATLTVSVTAIGSFDLGSRALLRNGAKAGDAILVTGALGASALGLRRLADGDAAKDDQACIAHLRPRAQVEAGITAASNGASAAIDISDGLLGDLEHILSASGVGASLLEIPVFEQASLDEALYGGEDYQLIIVTPEPEALILAFSKHGLEPPFRIGTCLEDPTARFLFGQPYLARGYQHKL